jgi:hypothetical protein
MTALPRPRVPVYVRTMSITVVRVVACFVALSAASILAPACRRGGGAGPDTEGPPEAEAACVPASPEAVMECVESARWSADLARLSGVRTPRSPKWQEAQDLCASRFAEQGYQVERFDYGGGIDVIGVKPGAVPEEVVVSAHYDGVENCPAADDNASGTAGLLESARILAAGRFERTLVVACWDDEENGMVGSKAWAARARSRGETIAASLVYEMIGFRSTAPNSQTLPPGTDAVFPDKKAWLDAREWRGDFIAVVADTRAHESVVALERWAEPAGLPVLAVELPALLLSTPLARPLYRSDHSAFWENDYPGVMITDTADYRNPRYPCTLGDDSPESLDPEFAGRVVKTVTAAAVELLRVRPAE